MAVSLTSGPDFGTAEVRGADFLARGAFGAGQARFLGGISNAATLSGANPLDLATDSSSSEDLYTLQFGTGTPTIGPIPQAIISTANGGASAGFSAETQIGSIVVSGLPHTYNIIFFCTVFASGTVATDRMELRVRLSTSAGAIIAANEGIVSGSVSVLKSYQQLGAPANTTLVFTLARSSGTGTLTTFSDATTNYIWCLTTY